MIASKSKYLIGRLWRLGDTTCSRVGLPLTEGLGLAIAVVGYG